VVLRLRTVGLRAGLVAVVFFSCGKGGLLPFV
jgi:hypothetical protein